MKKLIFTLFISTFFFHVANAASGIFEYFIDTKLNSTLRTHGNYPTGTSFGGDNLGTITTASDALIIEIAGVKTFKNGLSNVTGATLFYRVYKSGTAAPAYSSQNLPFGTNIGAGGDQLWQNASDISLAALAPTNGSYDVDIYFVASSSDGSLFVPMVNDMAPLKATFTRNVVVLANELTSFSATKQASQVNLSWFTASEKANDHFSIERSKDGRNFAAIGQMKGAVNSTVTKEYVYTDATPMKGINYYRLKSTEIGGKTTLSNVISVSLSDKNNKTFVYPNPVAQSALQLEHEAISDAELSIQIMDITGRTVQTTKRAVINGSNVISLDVNNLSSGQYLIAIDEQLIRFVKN
jgi:hypothetical protein